MRKNALVILVAVSIAVLLLVAAGLTPQQVQQPHPYAAASWLAAVLAFGVCAVMLAEYFIVGRRALLYLAGAFLALGITGIWDSLTLPYDLLFGSEADAAVKWTHLALWQMQWATLALGLGIGVGTGSKPQYRHKAEIGRAISVIAGGLLWASIVIFVTSSLPAASEGIGGLSTLGSIILGIAFAIACLAYIRPSVHRTNSVLRWMGYGLIFAILAQAAMALRSEPSATLFGFASVMKVVFFIFPLAGMLAEHTSLQVKMRHEASDLSSLVLAQQAVGSTSAPPDVLQRLAELISATVPSAAVCLMPFDNDRGLIRVAAQVGFEDEAARQLVFRPGEGPVGESFSLKDTVLVRDVLEDDVMAQKLAGVSGLSSAICIPLISRDECHGVLATFFSDSHRPGTKCAKDQMRMLDALAVQAAVGIEVAKLRGRALDSARTTDDYARELEIVWDIGQAVASELDLNALVDRLSDELKRAVQAKTCSVVLFEPDDSDVTIMGHRTLSRYKSIPDHLDQCDTLATLAVQTGEPMTANNVPNSPLCKYPHMALDDGGTHHGLAVPFESRGQRGAVIVIRQNAEPFGEKEKRLLSRLTPVVAAGIRNADLYEREKHIAKSLQESLLPKVEQHYRGMQVAGGHRVAFDASMVGGDFYDVLDLGDGCYGIAMGDVAGRGLDAAVYTAMSRFMIQAYSMDDPNPVAVMTKLNNALCRYTPTSKFVTIIYGIVDTKARTFTYVNAGQEPPFVYSAQSGELDTLATTGPAAGALANGEYVDQTVPFEPNDMIIFYTDGATEAKHNGKFLGTEGFKEMVMKNLHMDPERMVDATLEAVRAYTRFHVRDDIAILVVKSMSPDSLF